MFDINTNVRKCSDYYGHLTNFNISVVGGNELKRIRKLLGFRTQDDLADFLSEKRGKVAKWESDAQVIPIEYEYKLKQLIKEKGIELDIVSEPQEAYRVINSDSLENQIIQAASDYRMTQTKVRQLVSGDIAPSNDKEMQIVDIFKINNELIPYYDVDFFAGDSMTQFEQTAAPTYYIDFKPFKGCDAFNSYSDSMCPKIESGMMLFGVKKPNWREYLEFGEIYGIVMSDNSKFLKYIRKSEDKNNFLLISENKDYDSFEIPKSQIKSIWLIKGWVRIKTT